jgi:hypothetical protein
MNGNRKFKEIYDKFNGNFADLIIEHVIVIKELEKCRKMLHKQTSKGEER